MRSGDNGSDVPMSWMTWLSWNWASTTLCISSRALLMISMILWFLLSIQHWLCVCMCWLNTLSASYSPSIKNNSTNKTSLSSRPMESPAMVCFPFNPHSLLDIISFLQQYFLIILWSWSMILNQIYSPQHPVTGVPTLSSFNSLLSHQNSLSSIWLNWSPFT